MRMLCMSALWSGLCQDIICISIRTCPGESRSRWCHCQQRVLAKTYRSLLLKTSLAPHCPQVQMTQLARLCMAWPLLPAPASTHSTISPHTSHVPPGLWASAVLASFPGCLPLAFAFLVHFQPLYRSQLNCALFQEGSAIASISLCSN